VEEEVNLCWTVLERKAYFLERASELRHEAIPKGIEDVGCIACCRYGRIQMLSVKHGERSPLPLRSFDLSQYAD
jgi:hypothetical protein